MGWVGWGGVVGEVRDKAISTQVVVEVDVGVELGKMLYLKAFSLMGGESR